MTSRVVPISNLRLRYEPQPWRFADENRDRINAHFDRLCRERPQIWNGRVLVMHKHRLSADGLEGEFLETDFASFLAWRDWGFPDAGAINCFSMGALRSRDGAWMMGIMGAHTSSAGRIYFPAGTPDSGDIVDGMVDLAGSVIREMAEETGLGAGDFTEACGWYGVFHERRIALMRVMQAHDGADILRDRIRAYLAGQDAPELADVRIVRSPRDFDPMMPPFVTAFVDHMAADIARS